MKSFNYKNKYLITILVIVLVAITGVFITRSSSQNDNKYKEEESSLPDVEILPTVDDSVKVELTADKLKQRVNLVIKGIPSGTETIEYEMTYEKDENGERVLDGAYGSVEFDGKEPFEREIVLGTESKGVYRYHKGVDSIRISIKFNGSSGGSIYENTFEI